MFTAVSNELDPGGGGRFLEETCRMFVEIQSKTQEALGDRCNATCDYIKQRYQQEAKERRKDLMARLSTQVLEDHANEEQDDEFYAQVSQEMDEDRNQQKQTRDREREDIQVFKDAFRELQRKSEEETTRVTMEATRVMMEAINRLQQSPMAVLHSDTRPPGRVGYRDAGVPLLRVGEASHLPTGTSSHPEHQETPPSPEAHRPPGPADPPVRAGDHDAAGPAASRPIDPSLAAASVPVATGSGELDHTQARPTADAHHGDRAFDGDRSQAAAAGTAVAVAVTDALAAEGGQAIGANQTPEEGMDVEEDQVAVEGVTSAPLHERDVARLANDDQAADGQTSDDRDVADDQEVADDHDVSGGQDMAGTGLDILGDQNMAFADPDLQHSRRSTRKRPHLPDQPEAAPTPQHTRAHKRPKPWIPQFPGLVGRPFGDVQRVQSNDDDHPPPAEQEQQRVNEGSPNESTIAFEDVFRNGDPSDYIVQHPVSSEKKKKACAPGIFYILVCRRGCRENRSHYGTRRGAAKHNNGAAHGRRKKLEIMLEDMGIKVTGATKELVDESNAEFERRHPDVLTETHKPDSGARRSNKNNPGETTVMMLRKQRSPSQDKVHGVPHDNVIVDRSRHRGDRADVGVHAGPSGEDNVIDTDLSDQDSILSSPYDDTSDVDGEDPHGGRGERNGSGCEEQHDGILSPLPPHTVPNSAANCRSQTSNPSRTAQLVADVSLAAEASVEEPVQTQLREQPRASPSRVTSTEPWDMARSLLAASGAGSMLPASDEQLGASPPSLPAAAGTLPTPARQAPPSLSTPALDTPSATPDADQAAEVRRRCCPPTPALPKKATAGRSWTRPVNRVAIPGAAANHSGDSAGSGSEDGGAAPRVDRPAEVAALVPGANRAGGSRYSRGPIPAGVEIIDMPSDDDNDLRSVSGISAPRGTSRPFLKRSSSPVTNGASGSFFQRSW